LYHGIQLIIVIVTRAIAYLKFSNNKTVWFKWSCEKNWSYYEGMLCNNSYNNNSNS